MFLYGLRFSDACSLASYFEYKTASKPIPQPKPELGPVDYCLLKKSSPTSNP
jgi:hypothetical protein